MRLLLKSKLYLLLSNGAIVIGLVLLFVFNLPVVFWVLIAFSVGVSVGHLMGWERGFDAKQEVLEDVYGEDWQNQLSLGNYLAKIDEEAEKN